MVTELLTLHKGNGLYFDTSIVNRIPYFMIKMQTVVLEGKKKRADGPSSDELEDSVHILRSKAQGRLFPGSSWFDGKHLRTNIENFISM